MNFLATAIVSATLGYGVWLVRKQNLPYSPGSLLAFYYSQLVPFGLFLLLFTGVYLEIDFAFHRLHPNGLNDIQEAIRITVLQMYALLYVSLCFVFNNKNIQSPAFNRVLYIPAAIVIFTQLTLGIDALGDLRNSGYAWMRYLNITVLAFLWWNLIQSMKIFDLRRSIEMWVMLALHTTILIVIGSEYIHWVTYAGFSNQFNLGLSIIFGLYALYLVFRGLRKDIKYLRIAGMVLFGIAVMKLFAYDMQTVSTIGKTIILVGLGILLLCASFLYNKYFKVAEK